MIKMKKFLLAILVLYATLSHAQQEPQYTQNQFNSNLEINPAYAGINGNPSLSVRSRKQWSGFTGSPATLRLVGESNLVANSLSAGLTLSSEWIGITHSTSADLNVSTRIKVGRKASLSFGLKAGINMLSSDFSKLSNVDPTDPLYSTEKRTIPFVGFGALLYTDKVYIGFSMPRLVSFEQVEPQSKITKPHTYIYGGYRLKANDDIELRPALLGKYVAAAPFEMDIALDAWYKNVFGIGGSYRTSDAVCVMVKTRISKLYLGYSYDMTISALGAYHGGSHEIYLGYEFAGKNDPDRKQNNRYF